MRLAACTFLVLLNATLAAGCFGSSGPAGHEGGADEGVSGNVTRVAGLARLAGDAAAQDRRFGEDRPLTYADLWGLLPQDALTDYNTTRDYLLTMVPKPEVAVFEVNVTLENRIIFGVLITDDGVFHPDRPTVMLTCSQHGNEPSGSEACLIFIEYLVHGTDDLANDVRQKVNVVMLPLANPDGKEGNQRANHDGIDINRDHMDMVTIEGRAIHEFYNFFDPEIILDLHEFGGAGSQHPLYPTVPVSTYDYFQVAAPQTFYNNDEPMLRVTYELEATIIQHMWEERGIASSSHYKSQNFVSSIQRNHYGMHNSISLLFETGGGLGTNNIDLRTRLQIEATVVVLEWVLANPAAVLALERDADASSSAPQHGIQGWLVPPQSGDVAKLRHFLGIHNITYAVLDADATFMAGHYETGAESPPQSRSFPNGTLHISRYQADGRVAYEIFEAQHDDYYDHGPRDWGLDVWRILEA